jgi:hypothetical protein
VLAGCLVAAVLSLVAGLALGRLALVGAAAAFCLLGIPLAVVNRSPPGWPQRIAAGWTAVVAGCCIAGVVTAIVLTGGAVAGVLVAVSIVGSLLSTWMGIVPDLGRRARR